MKKEKLILILVALASAALSFVPELGVGVFSLLAVPFTALGWLLRTLSLSGPVGNGAALILYGLVCAVPLVFWWRSKRRTEDWLLVLLSGILALVLYYMINPNLRQGLWQNDVGDAVYSLPVWSALVAWGVLKLVVEERMLERNIYRCLRIFLLLCAAASLADCFGTELRNFVWYLQHYSSAGYGVDAGMTVGFLFVKHLIRGLESFLTAFVLYKGMGLLDALEADPFSEACVAAAEEVSRRCRSTLAIITLSSLFLNLAQLLLNDLLLNVQMELALPVMGLAVSFTMLAVTKLLVRGKELKDETDLFI